MVSVCLECGAADIYVVIKKNMIFFYAPMDSSRGGWGKCEPLTYLGTARHTRQCECCIHRKKETTIR